MSNAKARLETSEACVRIPQTFKWKNFGTLIIVEKLSILDVCGSFRGAYGIIDRVLFGYSCICDSRKIFKFQKTEQRYFSHIIIKMVF